MVRKFLYLAALSMMVTLMLAPAALAQQGGGLCAGAQAVTSLSGSAADGEVESEPFNISTDLFQAAVDNTSGAPEGEEGSTRVALETDRGGEVEVGSMRFGDGEDGIFNASNTGNGPFQVEARSTLQAYDITVYECPGGAPPTPEPEPTAPEPTTPDDDVMEPTTPAPTTPEPTVPNNGSGMVQHDDDTDDATPPTTPSAPNGEEPDGSQDDPQRINVIPDRNDDGKISPIEAAQADADTTQGKAPYPGTGDVQQPTLEDSEEPAPIVDRTGAVTEYVPDSVRDFGDYYAVTLTDAVGDIRQGRLPDTGGGWTVLLISGTALVGGGWFLARRFSR